jgi:hypothetical protein
MSPKCSHIHPQRREVEGDFYILGGKPIQCQSTELGNTGSKDWSGVATSQEMPATARSQKQEMASPPEAK